MNITRYTPFRDFENLLAQWRAPWDEGFPEFKGGKWMPSVDISETDNEYLIKVEVPEVKPEDLHLEVGNGMLTIKGERHESTEDRKRHRTDGGARQARRWL